MDASPISFLCSGQVEELNQQLEIFQQKVETRDKENDELLKQKEEKQSKWTPETGCEIVAISPVCWCPHWT